MSDNPTNGELYDALLACGFTFSFLSTGSLSVASPLLGWDRENTRRACRLGRIMNARWKEFAGYAELRLLAEGHQKPDWKPPTRETP